MIEFYTKEELELMKRCGCFIHKVVMVVDPQEEMWGIFDHFADEVGRGKRYIEKTFCDGNMWKKEVVVFGDEEGLRGWLREFPGDIRYLEEEGMDSLTPTG